MNRYRDRKIALNQSKRDKSFLKKRGFEQITHYTTPIMFHPKDVSLFGIRTTAHIWKRGDHYYKLAYRYYGNPSYWWVIAFYNLTPTENLLRFGDEILIPLDLQVILDVISI